MEVLLTEHQKIRPQHALLGSIEEAARNVSCVDTMISEVLLVASLSSLSV